MLFMGVAGRTRRRRQARLSTTDTRGKSAVGTLFVLILPRTKALIQAVLGMHYTEHEGITWDVEEDGRRFQLYDGHVSNTLLFL